MTWVFDLEADGWRDEATQMWVAAMKNADDPYGNTWDTREPYQLFNNLHVEEIAGHNILNYDLPLLKRLYGFEPTSRVVDTLVLSRLLNSDRPRPAGTNAGTHSLEAWGYRVGRGKPSHDDWTKYSEEMKHRCREDVEINVLTLHKLRSELQQFPGIEDAVKTEHRIAEIITQQEINGVPLDLSKCTALQEALRSEITEIDAEVVPLVPEVPLPKSKQWKWPEKQFKKDGTATVHAKKYYGEDHDTYRTDIIVRTEPMNLGSDKQVKEYLLSLGWKPTEWNYKKENGREVRDENGNKIKTSPKITEDSLDSVKWKPGQEFIGERIVRRLKIAHRLSAVEGWLRDVRPDGRISALAIPCGTPTGRMTHRQVVNVPGKQRLLGEELRSCFTTIPGYTRVGIDLSSCQLRGLCHYMGDEDYQKQVLEGDPHQFMADLAGLPDRQDGKKLNYTILFGGGVDKVATDLGLTKKKAKEVMKTLFSNLPKLKELQDKLRREWKSKGYLTGLDGRPIWVRAEHMLLVYLMQALESVVMKNFMMCIDDNSNMYDHQLVTTMHDEVQYLVLDKDVALFKKYANSAIEYVNSKFDLQCQQDIDIHTGETWAECH